MKSLHACDAIPLLGSCAKMHFPGIAQPASACLQLVASCNRSFRSSSGACGPTAQGALGQAHWAHGCYGGLAAMPCQTFWLPGFAAPPPVRACCFGSRPVPWLPQRVLLLPAGCLCQQQLPGVRRAAAGRAVCGAQPDCCICFASWCSPTPLDNLQTPSTLLPDLKLLRKLIGLKAFNCPCLQACFQQKAVPGQTPAVTTAASLPPPVSRSQMPPCASALRSWAPRLPPGKPQKISLPPWEGPRPAAASTGHHSTCALPLAAPQRPRPLLAGPAAAAVAGSRRRSSARLG